MDFKKIVWIFFFAFLGLNIFLFSIYWDGLHQQNLISQTSRVEDLAKRLENDEISYKGDFSNEVKEGYYLSGEQTDLGKALYESENEALDSLKQGASITGYQLGYNPPGTYTVVRRNIGNTLKEFLADDKSIMYGEDYRYVSELSDLNKEHPQIIAAQYYEGIPFNDDTARLAINVNPVDSGKKVADIEDYTQTHLDNIEALREKMNLYSEKEIINTLYLNNRFPRKSKILKTFLGYYRILEVREKNVYIPVWFVWVESSDKSVQIEKVNAISNTLIINNLVPKVENR